MIEDPEQASARRYGMEQSTLTDEQRIEPINLGDCLHVLHPRPRLDLHRDQQALVCPGVVLLSLDARQGVRCEQGTVPSGPCRRVLGVAHNASSVLLDR